MVRVEHRGECLDYRMGGLFTSRKEVPRMGWEVGSSLSSGDKA
jgi:hypothetical protein